MMCIVCVVLGCFVWLLERLVIWVVCWNVDKVDGSGFFWGLWEGNGLFECDVFRCCLGGNLCDLVGCFL